MNPNKPHLPGPVPHSIHRKRSERLLSLAELLAVAPSQGSAYLGLRTVPSERVIGSENRSADFGEDFLPVHSRMDERWRTIQRLMLAGSLNEPVSLFEYGSVYFVRDGNHRCSVARYEGITDIQAEITRLETPLRFTPGLCRRDLPLVAAQWALQRASGIFDHLDQEGFEVRLPDTWPRLGAHIEQGHRPWMRRKTGRDPQSAELFRDWYAENYLVNCAEIERSGLLSLFPGWGLTDVYVALMDYWHTHPGWLSEVWRGFRASRRRQSLLLRWRHGLHSLAGLWRRDPATERERFLRMSNLLAGQPGARIPEGSGGWYRFLLGQLMDAHAAWYLGRHAEPPTLRELSTDWYRGLLEPAIKLYREHHITAPFPEFYQAWMRVWRREVLAHRDPGLEGSLRLVLKQGKWHR